MPDKIYVITADNLDWDVFHTVLVGPKLPNTLDELRKAFYADLDRAIDDAARDEPAWTGFADADKRFERENRWIREQREIHGLAQTRADDDSENGNALIAIFVAQLKQTFGLRAIDWDVTNASD